MALRDLLPSGPTVTIREELASSGTAQVAAGTWDGHPVVLKAVSSQDPCWQQRFVQEIAAHQVFAAHAPPVPVAGLRYTDGQRLLVLDHLPGAPWHPERYPESVSLSQVDAVATILTRLHAWSPPAHTALSHVVGNEHVALGRLDQAGWAAPADRAVLHELVADSSPTELAHGDPVPSNLLVPSSGAPALLDWEFAGLRRPGWDLALLHTLLARTPAAQQRIAACARDTAVQAGFLLNRALVIAREWRTHHDLPPGALRTQRLTLLRTAWTHLQHDLHQSTS